MINRLFELARPFIHSLDAETAHHASIMALKLMPLPERRPDPACLKVQAFGLSFPNPVGLAAGFDKNAEVPDQALRLGFGFVEVGGVTPLPQPGNPKPRVFRLADDGAVINRYGLNNDGAEAVRRRLATRRRSGIVGINIGANKEGKDRTADYVALVRELGAVCDYFSINVSSPNTPGLRNLQGKAMLDDLLARVIAARDALPIVAGKQAIPLLLKIAPDVSKQELDDIVTVARNRRIEGIIVSNTTVQRPATLRNTLLAKETGGLSGRPLFDASTRILAQTYLRVEGQFPLIGVGGIGCAETARAKLEAGATLIQFYSAMVFKGPGLAHDIVTGLKTICEREGLHSITALTGQKAKEWADQ